MKGNWDASHNHPRPNTFKSPYMILAFDEPLDLLPPYFSIRHSRKHCNNPKMYIRCTSVLNDTFVPGETSSGKSTLLNLILGEQLLPYSVLSTTSTICELKYGPTPKLVAHFKDKDPQTGQSTKTVQLSKGNCLEEISSFVHVKTDREKGSDYKKIELFCSHSLLKVGYESRFKKGNVCNLELAAFLLKTSLTPEVTCQLTAVQLTGA